MPLDKAYKYTSQVMSENMMALDAKEGISAFIEKKTKLERQMSPDDLIKETLKKSKVIAMVGASVPKENEAVAKMRLKNPQLLL